MTPQSIATIATFLTLTSLLGTFFQVQLATWLRDLMTLKSKYELNAGDNPTADEIKALRECAYTLSGLYNKVPALTAGAITLFIAITASQAFAILSTSWSTDPLASRIGLVLGSFLAIYLMLGGYLMWRGYAIGRELHRNLV